MNASQQRADGQRGRAESLSRRHSVNVVGEGKTTLVLSHGLGTSQEVWRAVVPLLATDFRLVLFDHAGAGNSDPSAFDPDRHSELLGFADDLRELIESLALEGSTLVGHSMGASIGFLAAARSPHLFDRLVLVAPSPRYLADPTTGYPGGFQREDVDRLLTLMEENLLGWCALMAGHAVKERDLSGEFLEILERTDPVALKCMAKASLLGDHRAFLPRVVQPTLLVACEHDDLVPREVSAYMRDHMPRAEVAYVPGAGHCPQMSHPTELVRVVRAFLARDLPGSRA